jgi:hypothetical protein
MQRGSHRLRAGRGRAFAAALAILLAPLGCGPASRDLRLPSAAAVQRLGEPGAVVKLDGVFKTALAGSGSGTLRVELSRLPASRLWLAAGREAGGAVQCEARLEAPGQGPRSLASLQLPEAPRWVDAFAELPAVEGGALVLACEPGAASPVVWARPLVIPRDPGRPPPLLVLLSLDTLRADHVGGFGAPPGATPHLDRLGDEGLRFVAAASEGTWTLPSHHTLFTSQLFGFPSSAAPSQSLAAAFAAGGFATAAITGGGWVGGRFFQAGFDHFAENAYTQGDDLAWVLERASQWLERLREVPAFLFLHSYAVHQTPPAYAQWLETHRVHEVFAPTPAQLEQDRAFYRDLVQRTDRELAPLFGALRELAESRPLLLVVVSDHGQAFGEHHNYGHGAAHTSVTLHDEVVRVPFLVWGPRLVPSGRTSDRPVGLADAAPSMLAAAGLPAAPGMRGANLWPLWSGSSSPPAGTTGSVTHIEGSWSLREAGQKLIVSLRPEGDTYQLYDLASDPGERIDRTPQDHARVRESRSRLLRRLSALGAAPEPREGEPAALPRIACQTPTDPSACASERARAAAILRGVEPDVREQLRGLGYLDPESD